MSTSVATPAYWKIWERNGKSEFARYIKLNTKENGTPFILKDGNLKNPVFRTIYELLTLGVRSTLKKDFVISLVSEVASLHPDFPSMVLDVISIIDAETLISASDGLQDERFVFSQIVKDLEKVLTEKMLKERLEIDTLQDVGTIQNRTFYTKFIKVKTKLYYKQRRFNLFREESEGYAKLITELNPEVTKHLSTNNVLDIVKSLIGCFNLDPNRVLDVILESFEARPQHHKFFIPLIQNYMPIGSIICEVLGYKFRNYSDRSAPISLYTITAMLLQAHVIELNDMYSWLSPVDDSILTDWEFELNEAHEFVRKLNVISTNKDKETDVVEERIDIYTTKYPTNQKWNLCEALLKVGDWSTAQKLIKKLPEYSVLVHESIACALARLVHLVIEPVYMEKFNLAGKGKTKCELAYSLSNTVKKAHTLNDLRTEAFPMVMTLGPSLHFDSVLLFKLLRLMRSALSEYNFDTCNVPTAGSEMESLYYDILSVLDTAILPALSYMDCNCCVAEEIWSIIKFFPYHFRYSLYARWKNDTYQIHPNLIRRRGSAQKQIKSLMKRVSKENVKPVGRLIGKLSHCSPGFLFDYILLQIQIYDNLIGPVVDSLKYLTSLSYDVLGYCLIESLAQADRDRFKHDGTSLSMWLQSLANFCGAIFKKYNIELSGLLQYVANQLKSHKSLDLLILKEVVQKMAGIEAAEEMTIEQLNAMAGGELLRSEAGYFSQVRNTKKSSFRLKEALANNDLAVTLCLLIAQQKHCVIYRETARSHLKLVGKLYDQCQDTLVQFGTFLGSTYSVEEYVERLPSIHNMLQEYHIHADVAFFLARPMFLHQINQKYDQLRKSDPNFKKLTTIQKQEKYLEATDAIIAPIVQSVRPLHPPKIWEDISPQFLVTFWSLSMYDLQVPTESYNKEIAKLKQLSLSVMDSKEMNATKGKKEQERYIALMDKLQDEKKKQQEHVDKIMHRLNQEKDSWFLSRSARSAKNETITQFLQLCLFPRCTFTALDAVYCAKFVQTIHNLKTANFSTLLCYDRIFCDITYSVTSCTENEATRYGRFLCAMLETLMRWHGSQATFNKECANYPGFVTKFRVSNQFSEANDHVGYENYRHVCHKWHYKITKAIVFCLDSKDYMQIRNALIILKLILPHYPVIMRLAQIIEKRIEKVREEEKNQRQDLFVLASSYIGQLKSKSDQMIREHDFHQVSDKPIKEGGDAQPVKSLNGDSKQDIKKEVRERGEKKISSKLSTVSSSSSPSTAKDNGAPVKESREIVFNNDTVKTSKELKREEKQREKEENDTKKRDKEKRREKKNQQSAYYESEKYHAIDSYEHEPNDRDRDLSSVSNSSCGSIQHHRSQENNAEFESKNEAKRRKIDNNSKKTDDLSPISIESSKKERSSKTRERKERITIEDVDLTRKEKKIGRKRDREDDTFGEQKRRKDDDKVNHSNGDDIGNTRDKRNFSREKSPQLNARDYQERSHDRNDREKTYNMQKSTRTRSSNY